jgi:hypothetical protein
VVPKWTGLNGPHPVNNFGHEFVLSPMITPGLYVAYQRPGKRR